MANRGPSSTTNPARPEAIRTRKSHGVYVVPVTEGPKLLKLFKRYGIGEDSENGTAEAIQIVPVDEGENGDMPETVIAY